MLNFIGLICIWMGNIFEPSQAAMFTAIGATFGILLYGLFSVFPK